MREICSKVTIETLDRPGVFIANLEQILQIALAFL